MCSEKPFLHPFLSPHPHPHGSGLFPPAATLGPVQTSLRAALSWAELCSPKVVLEFLILSTSDCDCIWRLALYRDN